MTGHGPVAETDVLQEAADRIEAELICCDVFERLHDKPAELWTSEERSEARSHSICYWGEAARRIVLGVRTPPDQTSAQSSAD